MTEEWRPYPHNERYHVSNLGRVKGLKGQILSPAKNENGYPCVGVKINGKHKTTRVHRMVLQTFVGPCPPGHEGAHLDGNRSNARLDNLQWVTPSENCRHAKIHGTRADFSGEKAPHARLKEGQIRDILEQMLGPNRTDKTARALAKKYGVFVGHIKKISYGVSWKHLYAEYKEKLK